MSDQVRQEAIDRGMELLVEKTLHEETKAKLQDAAQLLWVCVRRYGMYNAAFAGDDFCKQVIDFANKNTVYPEPPSEENE